MDNVKIMKTPNNKLGSKISRNIENHNLTIDLRNLGT